VLELGLNTTSSGGGMYTLQLPSGYYTISYNYEKCRLRILSVDLTKGDLRADIQLFCGLPAFVLIEQKVQHEKVMNIKASVSAPHTVAGDGPGVWAYIPADAVPFAIRQWKAYHPD
jgi:hypothetical protein